MTKVTLEQQQNVILLISDALAKGGQVQDAGWRLGKDIENAILRCATSETGTNRWKYFQKSRHMVWNLRQNPGSLCQRLQTGDLVADELLLLRPEEIDPDRWAPVYAKLEQKRVEREKAEKLLKGAKGLFRCSKRSCRSMDTFHWQLQTRRADEGMTTYVECRVCSNRYKMS